MVKLLPVSILLIFLLAACNEEDKTSLLIGKWKGASWTVNGKVSALGHQSVQFEFNNDQTYMASFGKQFEAGTFRLSGDKLYTTADNQAEKVVKLSTFSADTLVMDMNRAGDTEQLLLVKSK